MAETPETPSVLVIDDTPANRRLVVEALGGQGYRVLIAQDGEEGIERARLVQPDLILLDVRMPGIDGFETCRRLKARPELSEIPVIFMTALSDKADKVSGFEAGGVDYITKPFQIDELLARVATHVKLRALQKQLEAQNAELRSYRDSLEQQVAARTEEVRLMSHALNRVHEAAYLTDEDARIIYVNEEACRALGYSEDELLRMTIRDIDPEVTSEIWAAYWNSTRQDGSATIEAANRRKDGSRFPIEVNASYFEFGGKAYHLALVRDITERKEAERRLKAGERELSARREMAREEEGRRIAREIHDELGQNLTALRMGISTLRMQFGNGDPALAERVQDLMELADRALRVVREIAAALRPTALDAGLQAGIEWLAAEFRRHAGIPCRLDLPSEPLDLDDGRATALFRIVQESLTNIARHANAKSASVSLRRDGDGWRAEVRDDGRGFDPTTVGSKSFGLVSMRERALMLGGELAIESAWGGGSVVTVRLPYTDNREQP